MHLREASGGPLGRRWVLLARLLALLGVFWDISGAVWGRPGRTLDLQTFWGLMFGLFWPVWGCVFDVFSLLARGVAGAVCCAGFG